MSLHERSAVDAIAVARVVAEVVVVVAKSEGRPGSRCLVQCCAALSSTCFS